MSEYQLMYLRFLQVQRDFPGLNHDREHGPKPSYESVVSNGPNGLLSGNVVERQEREVEREFYRQW